MAALFLEVGGVTGSAFAVLPFSVKKTDGTHGFNVVKKSLYIFIIIKFIHTFAQKNL
jgi:hypothetical protein